MNSESTPAASSSAGPATPTNQRKERGAIAAQACDNCRQRKQRCSEDRPKCATCLRMGLECKYREPQPTKKDKTQVEILDRVKAMEVELKGLNDKFDELLSRFSPQPPTDPYRGATQPASGPSAEPTRSSPWSSSQAAHPATQEYSPKSGAHMLWSWPFIQQLLENVPQSVDIDLAVLQKSGARTLILGLRNRIKDLPNTLFTSGLMNEDGPSLGLGVLGLGQVDAAPEDALALEWNTIERLSKAYFDTFNLMHPIVDREAFETNTLRTVFHSGFDGGVNSTLTYLILALGQVAIAGTRGDPINVHKNRPSGVKGGLPNEPPGLPLFNEARKRMGFHLTDYTLEHVQIFSLAGIYYETCFLHAEFWRMAMFASLTLQAMLVSNPEELGSQHGDLLRRNFWHCSVMEWCLNIEFDLPFSGLEKFEHRVGLPDFSGPLSDDDYLANQSSHFQDHFASQMALRRLATSAAETIRSGSVAAGQGTYAAWSSLKDLALQLDRWRGLLPSSLRWEDGPQTSFSQTPVQQMYDPSILAAQDTTSVMFTADLDTPPVQYAYAADLQMALLRTRYYYVKFLTFRPYIYKALHDPDNMTGDDFQGVVECLKCMVPLLVRIRSSFMDQGFDADAEVTVRLCIDWIRDLKDVDQTALWCWTVLRNVIPLQDDM